MPSYVRRCISPSCPAHGDAFEQFARAAECNDIACPECGGATEPHPDQFSSVAVQREWARGRGGVERESKAMVFQEAGIPEIKRDCPSMEFKVADGEATPVFRNDVHHRRCMRELSKAKTRYEGEREAKKAEARAKSKRDILRKWESQT